MIKVMEEFPCKKKLNRSDPGQENGTAMIISVSGLSSSIMKKKYIDISWEVRCSNWQKSPKFSKYTEL